LVSVRVYEQEARDSIPEVGGAGDGHSTPRAVPDEDEPLEVQRVRDSGHVASDGGDGVRPVGRLSGAAVTTKVERHGAAPWPQMGELGRPLRRVSGERMDEQHRLEAR